METAKGILHSNSEICDVQIVKEVDNNNIVVITPNGVKCTAIYNPFTNLIYADDKYGVIE
ncbi:MAG: hypothetical protein FWC41_06555 [Firmicutes bacterium]|nr:hypothetical protein [Bacillota bacterium]